MREVNMQLVHLGGSTAAGTSATRGLFDPDAIALVDKLLEGFFVGEDRTSGSVAWWGIAVVDHLGEVDPLVFGCVVDVFGVGQRVDFNLLIDCTREGLYGTVALQSRVTSDAMPVRLCGVAITQTSSSEVFDSNVSGELVGVEPEITWNDGVSGEFGGVFVAGVIAVGWGVADDDRGTVGYSDPLVVDADVEVTRFRVKPHVAFVDGITAVVNVGTLTVGVRTRVDDGGAATACCTVRSSSTGGAGLAFKAAEASPLAADFLVEV